MDNKERIFIDYTEQFSLIGEYVVGFEQVVDHIRFTLNLLFRLKGLENWNMSEIVFNQRQFTAEPLISCFESIVNELFKENKDCNDILKDTSEFRKKFTNQIAFRNELLHGTFHFGKYVEVISDKPIDYDFYKNDFNVTKGVPNKEGSRIKQVLTEKNEIINNIELINMIIKDLWSLRNKIIINLVKSKSPSDLNS